MAADGGPKFDTKINVEGFEEGISTLLKVIDRLTGTISRLSPNILSRFNGARQTITKTVQNVGEASDAVKSIGESVDGLLKDAKHLQEQMDATRVQAMEAADTEPVEAVVVPTNPESLSYDSKVMAVVFGEETAEMHNHVKAVEQYSEQGAAALNKMDLEVQELKQQIEQFHVQDIEAVETTPIEACAVPSSAESVGYDPKACPLYTPPSPRDS